MKIKVQKLDRNAAIIDRYAGGNFHWFPIFLSGVAGWLQPQNIFVFILNEQYCIHKNAWVAAKKSGPSVCVMETITKEMLHEDGHGDYQTASQCA